FEAVVALGPAGRELAPLLRKRLHGEGHLALEAAESLLKLEPTDKEAVAAMKKALKNPEMRLRLEGVHAAGRLGEQARTFRTELEAARDHLAPSIRAAAREALKRIN